MNATQTLLTNALHDAVNALSIAEATINRLAKTNAERDSAKGTRDVISAAKTNADNAIVEATNELTMIRDVEFDSILSDDDREAIAQALRSFDVHVYDDARYDDSDTSAMIFASRQLSVDELRDYFEDNEATNATQR